jgi:hypothetical protein
MFGRSLQIVFAACYAMLFAHSVTAATIYKHIGSDGRVTYSNIYMPGSHKLNGIDDADSTFNRATKIKNHDLALQQLNSTVLLPPPPPPLAKNELSASPDERKKRIAFLKKMLDIELSRDHSDNKQK